MDERHPLLSTLTADPPRSPTAAPARPDILPDTMRLKLLEAAMDHVHESLLLFDRDGWIRYANAEASRATGYSPEELLSMRLSDLDPDWPPERWAEGWETVRRAGSLRLRSIHRRKDGSTFPVEIYTSHLPFGNDEYVAALHRDITERVAMEKQLHARAEEFRALVENSPDFVIRYDRDCRRTYANPAIVSRFGTGMEELLGKRPTDAGPQTLSKPVEYEACIRRVFETGEPQELVFPGRRHGDASTIFWSHARFAPERDAAGNVASVLVISRDVTALKAAELQWWTLVDTLPGMVMRHDTSGRLRFINASALATMGLAPGPFQEEQLGTDDEGRALQELVRQVAATGVPLLCNMTRSTPAGLRHFAMRYVPEQEGGTIKGVLGVASDVTEILDTQRVLEHLNRALTTLSSGNEALVRAADEGTLLAAMCRVLVETGHYPLAWIGFRGGDAPLEPVAWAGPEAALEALRPQVAHHPTALRAIATATPQLFSGCAAFPLRIGGSQQGVLVIHGSDTRTFNDSELSLLAKMADNIAYGIHSLRARADREHFMDQLRASMQSTIQALSSTLEFRDPYTAGHQRRVGALAVALAEALGWPDERIRILYLAALVHDIGKIAVPSEILSRPGRLTEVEFSLVRNHAEAGYEILTSSDFPWPIAEYVRQHHERLDGSGYPRGLKGDEITPEARVLAVADVVEAITTHRPYRPGLGMDAALAEIEHHCGTLFDTAVVDACLRLVREQGFGFD
jgi:PAS domain S-box-containing protein/putative nucleotidyltransferase with HDIG domain